MIDTTIITVEGSYNFNDSDGHGVGTTVSNQFNAKDTLHATDSNGDELYIPFHAVEAKIDITSFAPSDAVDANCGGAADKTYCESDTYALTDGFEYLDWNSDLSEGAASLSLSGPQTLYLQDNNGNSYDEYTVSSSNLSAVTVTDDGISEGHRWVTITPVGNSEAIIEFSIPGLDCVVAFDYWGEV